MKRMTGRRAGTVMPTLPPDMSDEKINDLVDYLVSLKGAAPAATTPPAKPTSVTGCETCHGPGKAHADAEQDAAGDPAKEMAGAKLIFAFNGSPKANSETLHDLSHHEPATGKLWPLAARGGGRLLQRVPRGALGERGQRSKQRRPEFGAGGFLSGAAAS